MDADAVADVEEEEENSSDESEDKVMNLFPGQMDEALQEAEIGVRIGAWKRR